VAARLRIGEVAGLTGITPGRIRHYDQLGLVPAGHLESGYRTFGSEEVLRLLHVDLLRRLGMGLEEIASALAAAGGPRPVLERHRHALIAERDRLEAMIAACDEALAAPAEEAMIRRLAEAQRARLGPFGRLQRPLSPAALERFRALLGEAWQLPVPGPFTQMLLPEPVTELLERLLATPGHEQLFLSLRELARRVLEVVASGDGEAADRLGADWVREQLTAPPPPAVLAELRRAAPRLARLAVIRSGFRLWAESLHPLAGRVLGAIEREAAAQDAAVLGAIVVPSAASAARRKASTSASTLRVAQPWRQASTIGSKGP
jgi:DNA-binding transcriptional MerR regulator